MCNENRTAMKMEKDKFENETLEVVKKDFCTNKSICFLLLRVTFWDWRIIVLQVTYILFLPFHPDSQLYAIYSLPHFSITLPTQSKRRGEKLKEPERTRQVCEWVWFCSVWNFNTHPKRVNHAEERDWSSFLDPLSWKVEEIERTRRTQDVLVDERGKEREERLGWKDY